MPGTPSSAELEFPTGGRATDAYVRWVTSLATPSTYGDAMDLRWVLVHLVNETARHAGHADATRELLDGASGEWGNTSPPGRVGAGMELNDAVDFARTNNHSVLTTIRKDGRPQLSNVAHHVSDDGVIRVSITADRAKYHNLVREPWAAMHVTRPDFYAYAVLEGVVELTPVAARPDDATVDELVEYYRASVGEHPDWDEYRATMVKDRRVIVRFRPTRAYGMLPR